MVNVNLLLQADCLYSPVCRHPFNTSETQVEFAQVCHHFKNKADFVEVVHCEDCKSYNGHRYCEYYDVPVMDDDYCSYGERRCED